MLAVASSAVAPDSASSGLASPGLPFFAPFGTNSARIRPPAAALPVFWPWKPDWLPEPGLSLAARRLRRGGILVSNTIDETARWVRAYRRLFGRALTLRLPDYENGIVVGCGEGLSARALRREIAAHRLLQPVLPGLTIRGS